MARFGWSEEKTFPIGLGVDAGGGAGGETWRSFFAGEDSAEPTAVLLLSAGRPYLEYLTTAAVTAAETHKPSKTPRTSCRFFAER